ncbi:hypothetical protein CIP107510_00572 [Corynebacterium diphtheriae]|uniref:hypothetical protein n=1 Tax=Corynebacterium diphtheriae TaxID=1717 RepID=UPI0013C7CC60|nr:hypothetical protein [Corynebacterium diphtheriae]MBG9276200.1 hypothetical protein [Corynebacterium diphtheriae bv. mitis]MBG9280594.1 hypothetical protein [Corynebacterium diphtheriae bv. mitis]CAB0540694.1 hypothetical protein CIP107510_00572 [Corynebacterium diphtheriae]
MTTAAQAKFITDLRDECSLANREAVTKNIEKFTQWAGRKVQLQAKRELINRDGDIERLDNVAPRVTATITEWATAKADLRDWAMTVNLDTLTTEEASHLIDTLNAPSGILALNAASLPQEWLMDDDLAAIFEEIVESTVTESMIEEVEEETEEEATEDEVHPYFIGKAQDILTRAHAPETADHMPLAWWAQEMKTSGEYQDNPRAIVAEDGSIVCMTTRRGEHGVSAYYIEDTEQTRQWGIANRVIDMSLGTIKRAIGMKVIEVSASSVCLGAGKKV